MRFEILDSAKGNKPVSRPRDYYLNGDGRLFYDCDPMGVDMSGKRRIVGADSNRFTVVAVPSASDNSIKAEIAAMCIELDCCMYEKFTKEMYHELRRRLRQLSAV